MPNKVYSHFPSRLDLQIVAIFLLSAVIRSYRNSSRVVSNVRDVLCEEVKSKGGTLTDLQGRYLGTLGTSTEQISPIGLKTDSADPHVSNPVS